MSESELKHLEFIQNVITRMNSNSFQIKGWTITIVTALIAIYASTSNSYFFLAGIFPTLVFWLLDSYYLNQERKFRGLYNDVAGLATPDREIKLFEMRPDLYTGGKYSYWSSFFSVTILKMYFSIVIILVALFIYFECPEIFNFVCTKGA